jgi:hypothetical protein
LLHRKAKSGKIDDFLGSFLLSTPLFDLIGIVLKSDTSLIMSLSFISTSPAKLFHSSFEMVIRPSAHFIFMGASDTMSIEVRREYYTVNAQGQARLQQCDAIKATGKTAREVSRLVESQVSQFRALS